LHIRVILSTLVASLAPKGKGKEMRMDNFFRELKRRNVYKVAVAYLVVAFEITPEGDQGCGSLSMN
jgi:hypothetical protein